MLRLLTRRRARGVRLLTALAILSALSSAKAVAVETYWVSPTGASLWANCNGLTPLSGTAACALTTANANVTAGNTVKLRGGAYTCGLILNGKSGTLTDRIVFEAYNDEAITIDNQSCNSIFTNRHPAMYLRASSYIVIRGMRFEQSRTAGESSGANFDYHWQVDRGSSYNEFDSIIVDCNSNGAVVYMHKGDVTLDDSFGVTNNWIHDSSFLYCGSVVNGNDEGGLQVGVFGSPYDHASGHNTFERVNFIGGGHHTIETFSQYNVIIDCFFDNAGFMSNSTPGVPTTYGPDTNSLWGNRNFQLYDGSYHDGMFNLMEGNRFGPSGPPPDDDGGDGMTITSPKNIIRYNEVYGAQNNGVLFKNGDGSRGNDNHFYQNTIFSSGRFDNTGPQWQGKNLRWYPAGESESTDPDIVSIEGVAGVVTITTDVAHRLIPRDNVTISGTVNYNGSYKVVTATPGTTTLTVAKPGTFALETGDFDLDYSWTGQGNVLKNNILYQAGSSDWSDTSGNPVNDNTFAGNFCTNAAAGLCAANGNPQFTTTTIDIFPATTTAPNLMPQAGSPVIDAGVHLTTAVGAASGSTTLTVADALYFQDGTLGSSLAGLQADWIAIDTVDNVVQIASVDYATNTITLASPMTWNDNDPIWLYKDSSGTRVLYGNAPDIGAFEFEGSTQGPQRFRLRPPN